MKRKFVIMPVFDKQWKMMGLNDDNLKELQYELLENSKKGTVIRGTGKLRKIRFAFSDKGKSSSCRVLYVDFEFAETIYLIFTYPKSEKDNITNEEKNNIKKLIDRLEQTL